MTDKVRMTTGGTAFGYPVSALRTEARKGNLALIRIAGKDYVGAAAIKEMERKCRNVARVPDYISETARDMAPAGLSSTAQSKSAQVAALNSCNRLKKRLPLTSQKTTGQIPGNVILLKSGAQT